MPQSAAERMIATRHAPRAAVRCHAKAPAAWLAALLFYAPLLHAATDETRTTMTSDDSARTEVSAAGVELQATFEPRDDGALHVRYRLRNAGDAPLAVFDRGDRHAVLTKRQAPGGIGVPLARDDAPERVTLLHAAHALPQPSPTVPPTPLAGRLDPGASDEAEFTFSHWLGDPPRQVRWCLGVAPFDAARMYQPETLDGRVTWQADFAYADDQQLLCTPWFDVAEKRFIEG